MSTTNLNIRTDKDIKEQAKEIFSELGLNMTTAVNMFLRINILANGDTLDVKYKDHDLTGKGISNIRR